MTTAYPLTWPEHIPRARTREKGKFSTSLTTALGNVQNSLKLFARDSGKPLSSRAQDRVRQLAKYLGWAKYSNGEWHITNAGRTAHLARTEGGQG